MALTPEQRSTRSRLAAHTVHARGRTNTGPAREAFSKRFLDEVDPDRVLPEADRDRRAEHARKAHFQRMALKSAQARSKRGERQPTGPAA